MRNFSLGKFEDIDSQGKKGFGDYEVLVTGSAFACVSDCAHAYAKSRYIQSYRNDGSVVGRELGFRIYIVTKLIVL